MTIILQRQDITANSGQRMFIECYADKPEFVPFWRYGFVEGVYASTIKDGLLTRPSIKRLKERF